MTRDRRVAAVGRQLADQRRHGVHAGVARADQGDAVAGRGQVQGLRGSGRSRRRSASAAPSGRRLSRSARQVDVGPVADDDVGVADRRGRRRRCAGGGRRGRGRRPPDGRRAGPGGPRPRWVAGGADLLVDDQLAAPGPPPGGRPPRPPRACRRRRPPPALGLGTATAGQQPAAPKVRRADAEAVGQLRRWPVRRPCGRGGDQADGGRVQAGGGQGLDAPAASRPSGSAPGWSRRRARATAGAAPPRRPGPGEPSR